MTVLYKKEETNESSWTIVHKEFQIRTLMKQVFRTTRIVRTTKLYNLHNGKTRGAGSNLEERRTRDPGIVLRAIFGDSKEHV